MEGWIKLHRKFITWEWFTTPEMVQLFMYFLLKANYEPKKWRGITVNIGQLITSNSKLRQDTGLTEQKIRTCIKRLISTNEITYQSTKQYVIITVCKYGDYQIVSNVTNDHSNEQNNEQLTNDQRTTNEQLTITQEINNNLTHIYTCARNADLDLKDCYNLLLKDISWTETFCMNNHLASEQFAEYLKSFFSELENRGETSKSEKDAKFYFSNWYNFNKNKFNGTKDRCADKADKARSLLTEYYDINSGAKQSPTDSEILNF